MYIDIYVQTAKVGRSAKVTPFNGTPLIDIQEKKSE